MDDDCTYVIGGVVDRKDKPGVSFERACHKHVMSARLPLERYIRFQPRSQGGSADLSTIAVVQLLLLWRETKDWGLAMSRCPALRSAPLRKYVWWLPPYEALNHTQRPPDPLIRGHSAQYESQTLVSMTARMLKWQ